jgi:hypothetical protein
VAVAGYRDSGCSEIRCKRDEICTNAEAKANNFEGEGTRRLARSKLHSRRHAQAPRR